jgi:hypothetical protein
LTISYGGSGQRSFLKITAVPVRLSVSRTAVFGYVRLFASRFQYSHIILCVPNPKPLHVTRNVIYSVVVDVVDVRTK